MPERSLRIGSTWRALVSADLVEVGRRRPLVAVLGFSRLLPELASSLLHGEGTPVHASMMSDAISRSATNVAAAAATKIAAMRLS